MEDNQELNPRKIAKKTLEDKFLQEVAGSNFAHTDFGKEGESVYDIVMEGEEVKKTQEEIYQEKKEDYKRRRVVGEPAYPLKQDVSYKIIEQIDENKKILCLGDLEQIVGSIAPNFEFELPENLKQYNYGDLIRIAIEKGAINKEDGELNIEKLSKEEQEAFEKYNILSKAYDKACSLQVLNLYSFAELNARDKAITEKYHPKEKEEKESA